MEWLFVILMANLMYLILKKLWTIIKKSKLTKTKVEKEALNLPELKKVGLNEPESKKLLKPPIYVNTLPDGTTKEDIEKKYKKVVDKKLNIQI